MYNGSSTLHSTHRTVHNQWTYYLSLQCYVAAYSWPVDYWLLYRLLSITNCIYWMKRMTASQPDSSQHSTAQHIRAKREREHSTAQHTAQHSCGWASSQQPRFNFFRSKIFDLGSGIWSKIRPLFLDLLTGCHFSFFIFIPTSGSRIQTPNLFVDAYSNSIRFSAVTEKFLGVSGVWRIYVWRLSTFNSI